MARSCAQAESKNSEKLDFVVERAVEFVLEKTPARGYPWKIEEFLQIEIIVHGISTSLHTVKSCC